MGKKVVICGCGNMGEGVLRSLLNKKVVDATDVTISEKNPARCDYLIDTYGVSAVSDASAAIAEADMVIIAVVPKIVPIITESIKKLVGSETIVLSIAAGVTIGTLEDQLGADKKVVRVMPNTLNQTGYGYSAVAVNANITEDDKTFVTDVINSLGQTMFLGEDMFNAFTAYSCSGPMWLYKMASELTDAGVYVGFSRAEAMDIVLKNMAGVAKVLEMTGEQPGEKVAQMCSPAGVTIEGLKALNDGGFSAVVGDSVAKAVAKANRVG